MLLSRHIFQFSRSSNRVIFNGFLGRTSCQRASSRLQRWSRVDRVVNKSLHGRLALKGLVIVPNHARATFPNTRPLHRSINRSRRHTATSRRCITNISLRNFRFAVLTNPFRQRKNSNTFGSLRRHLLRTLTKRIAHSKNIFTTFANSLISFISVCSTLLHAHRVPIDDLSRTLRRNFSIVTRVSYLNRHNNIHCSRQRIRRVN